MSQSDPVTAVIVTYNRLDLLKRCLKALAGQSLPPQSILVVDNASTDGTGDWLQRELAALAPGAEAILMPRNTGGAGGFHRGLRDAIERGAGWVWMMDDDAEPHVDALEQLMAVADNTRNVYGSLAVNEQYTAWSTTLLEPEARTVELAAQVPAHAVVDSLPFLGFLVHRRLTDVIGLPDPELFIAADDVEYCVRAQRAGADIVIAGHSRIEHPRSESYTVKTPLGPVRCLRLSPWKRYYDTRNRLLIARRHHGLRFFTQALPGTVLRYCAAMASEPHRWAQTRAFTAGILDALLGRSGMRHLDWGLQ